MPKILKGEGEKRKLAQKAFEERRILAGERAHKLYLALKYGGMKEMKKRIIKYTAFPTP